MIFSVKIWVIYLNYVSEKILTECCESLFCLQFYKMPRTRTRRTTSRIFSHVGPRPKVSRSKILVLETRQLLVRRLESIVLVETRSVTTRLRPKAGKLISRCQNATNSQLEGKILLAVGSRVLKISDNMPLIYQLVDRIAFDLTLDFFINFTRPIPNRQLDPGDEYWMIDTPDRVEKHLNSAISPPIQFRVQFCTLTWSRSKLPGKPG